MTQTPHQYPRSARLLAASDFDLVFNARKAIRGQYLCLHYRQNTQTSSARLGLVISKRFAPHAVTRNAIKRVVREHFRKNLHQLPVADFILRLQKKVPKISKAQLKKDIYLDIEQLLKRNLR